MPATRRPLVLAAAAATAAALGATALALPAVAAGKPSSGSGQTALAAAPTIGLKDGTLGWGFKDTFRKYVSEGGKIEVADGAKQAAGNGPFTFVDGKGTYDTSTFVNTIAFQGSVLFTTSHFTIKLSDVRVISDRKVGSIEADITLDGKTENDVALAKLDMTKATRGTGEPGEMIFNDIPATITAAGAKAFRYKEGDALDAANLSVKTDGGGRPSPSPSTSTSQSPSPSTSTSQSPSPSTSTSQSPSPSTSASASTSQSPSPSNSSSAKPPTSDGSIVDGNLDWGVKERFRAYVVGPIAHGKVELSAGAKNSGDIYRFPKAKGTFDAKKQSLSASFDGGVRFLGHLTDGEYVLDLKLSGFEVKVNGTQGSLIADVSTKVRKTGETVNLNDLKLATVAIPAGGLKAQNNVVKLSGAATTLTADGAKAFEGMYPAGESLDGLNLAVSLTEDAELPGGTGGSGSSSGGGAAAGGSGSTTGGGATGDLGGSVGGSVGGGSVEGAVGGSGALASTGSEIPTVGLIAASAGIAAAGAGVVFAMRRRQSAGNA